jgi:hypothetical protein
MSSVFPGNGFGGGFHPLNRPADQSVGSLLQVPETLVVLETAIQLAAEVPHAPLAKSQNDDAEFMTPVGKAIGGSRGVIAVELATYEAMCLKRFQTIGEHVGRHAGQAFLQVLKPHRAWEKVADDQQRPTGAHDIERPRHRTRRIKTILRHSGLTTWVSVNRSRATMCLADI